MGGFLLCKAVVCVIILHCRMLLWELLLLLLMFVSILLYRMFVCACCCRLLSLFLTAVTLLYCNCYLFYCCCWTIIVCDNCWTEDPGVMESGRRTENSADGVWSENLPAEQESSPRPLSAVYQHSTLKQVSHSSFRTGTLIPGIPWKRYS